MHNHYTATTDHSSLLVPLTKTAATLVGSGRKAKVASCYIRQMSEANLLIQSEQIQLLDRVGQGYIIIITAKSCSL